MFFRHLSRTKPRIAALTAIAATTAVSSVRLLCADSDESARGRANALEQATAQAYRTGKRPGPEWFRDGDFGANVTLLSSPAIVMLLTQLRDQRTSVKDYCLAADRLLSLLAEEGLARLQTVRTTHIQTPCGPYAGLSMPNIDKLAVVSIMRSGDILLQAVWNKCPGAAVGKILIQRDESHTQKIPKLYYSQLPKDIARREVMLVDPMLATGGSAVCAIEILLKAGVPEDKVMFLNVISCPEGIGVITQRFPKVHIVTLAVDPMMDDHKYIVPGLGDFGDRYFNTPH